jgi:nucleoside-diphosphate-sugar epimerase
LDIEVDVCDTVSSEYGVKYSFDYKDLNRTDLHQYSDIILLAGHSSVKSCEGPLYSPFKNNVDNFVNLLDMLPQNTRLLYASSSSVYGDSKNQIVSEDMLEFSPNNNYDLTKYLIDMINLGNTSSNIVGLRFGTVNGISPVLRTDVMINAMVNSAINENHIKLYVKEVHRPILGTIDLNRAIYSIITSGIKGAKFYNLASFNATAGVIASKVAELCGVPIVEIDLPITQQVSSVNAKLQTSAYDFSIDTQLFETEYNFKFEETIKSITEGLLKNWNEMNKVSRSRYIKY